MKIKYLSFLPAAVLPFIAQLIGVYSPGPATHKTILSTHSHGTSYKQTVPLYCVELTVYFLEGIQSFQI